MTFNFENSFNENRCAFFHLLDGYINDYSGNDVSNANQFILNNIIKPDKLNIKLYMFSNTNQDVVFTCYSEQPFKSLQLFNNELVQINSVDLNEELNNTKFIILDISCEKHATCLIVFKYNDKYYLCLINSGLYINLHKQHELNKELYKPYVLNEFDKIDDLINKLLLIHLYLSADIPNNSTFSKKFIDYLILQFNNLNLNIVKLNFNTQFYNIQFNAKGYNMIYNVLLFNNNDDNDNFIVSRLTQQPDTISISNEFIFKKIKFHEGIYIYPQQSGSCTWFCKYWMLCLYYLLYNQ